MKELFRTLIISCVLILLVITADAQKFSFKNYAVINGLSSSSVNNIFQDSRGYIWFGTQGGGASRFNGKEFRNFTKEDGLINNDVTFITEDKKGHIWIGTGEGVSEYDGIKFNNYNVKAGFTSGIVYGIYANETGKIWFASKEDGIKIFDGTKFDSLTTKNGLPSNEAYSIARDKRGNYWFGLYNGIAAYDGKKVTSYCNLPGVKDKTFFSTLTDDKGNIWFGSTSGDIVIIDTAQSIRQFELPQKVKKDFIGSMAQDKRGNIWFATDHGLLKYGERTFKLFTEKEGLSVNGVQSVLSDYEDNIWAGTLGGGVDLLSSETFLRYTDKDGLLSNNITCICPGGSKNFYYVGANDGLYTFNPGGEPEFKKVKGIKDIENISVSSLSLDKTGVLWISAQEGVFVVERKSAALRLVKKYLKIKDQSIISPVKVLHDSHGNCWIATFGSGLFLLNQKEERFFSTKNGFPSDKILSIFEDSKSNIWIGTQDIGVVKYDGKTFESLSPAKGFPDKAVWSITEDADGRIFFGTGESGLCCFNGEKYVTFTTKDGICSNYLTTVQWDKYEGCLWLGAEKGLSKIKVTNDFKIEKIHTYRERDGFNSNGVNQNAISIDSAGLVWLGSINGLWLFNPKYDFTKITKPKIQLTGIRLAYQKVDWRKFVDSIDSRTTLPANLELSYKNNHLTFDIQALTTDDVHYTFNLEGADKDWSPLTKTNEISYANIAPGKRYTFKAKAINSEGVISDETTSFSFIIDAPWYNTWWFRLVMLLSVVGLVVLIVKARERILKEQNLNLEKTVAQRTLEIARQKEIVEERNKSISKQKDLVEQTLTEKELLILEKDSLLNEKEVLLKEIHHRVKNNLQTISSMLKLQGAGLKDEEAKKAITESQSRVRSIALVHQKLYQTDGLEKVEFNAFVKDLTDQIKHMYGSQSEHVLIHWDIPETYLLVDAAIPMGLILNELLTNSFKYAFNKMQKGEIYMQFSNIDITEILTANKGNRRKRVKFIYRDSGPGIGSKLDLENASTLGLRLIKLLSEQIGATLSYSNNKGSEFVFIFAVNI